MTPAAVLLTAQTVSSSTGISLWASVSDTSAHSMLGLAWLITLPATAALVRRCARGGDGLA